MGFRLYGVIILFSWVAVIPVTRGFADEPTPSPTPTLTPPPLPPGAQRASWTAELVRATNPAEGIPELKLFDKKLAVNLLPKNGKLRPTVEIRGSFNREGWSLHVGNTRLIAPQHSGAQTFSLVAYLNGRTSDVTWTARGPHGESISEKIVLLAPEAQEFRIGSEWGDAMIFLGFTSFHFFQTQFGNYDSHTVMLAARYETPRGVSPFGLATDVNLTYFTLSATPDEYSPQTLAGSIDGTYRTHWTLNDGRIQPSYLLGIHYITMLSNGFPFGFSNLIAPELGMRFTFQVNPHTGWVGQIRYVPISGLVSTSEAEMDLNAGWVHTLENTHRVELDLGYWKLGYLPVPGTVIVNQLLYIRLGYSL